MGLSVWTKTRLSWFLTATVVRLLNSWVDPFTWIVRNITFSLDKDLGIWNIGEEIQRTHSVSYVSSPPSLGHSSLGSLPLPLNLILSFLAGKTGMDSNYFCQFTKGKIEHKMEENTSVRKIITETHITYRPANIVLIQSYTELSEVDGMC